MTDPGQIPQFSTAEFQPQLPDSHGYFVRALLFGIGGALLGMALYAGFVIVTHLEIGFVSLAVGWIVGKAILLGSRGRVGRRYQIAAALLTYAAVSMSAVPIGISQLIRAEKNQVATQPASSATGNQEGDSSSGISTAGVLKALGALTLIGLASPFLGLQEVGSGIIGLIILAVGMQIAWKMTGRTDRQVVDEALAEREPQDQPSSLDLNR